MKRKNIYLAGILLFISCFALLINNEKVLADTTGGIVLSFGDETSIDTITLFGFKDISAGTYQVSWQPDSQSHTWPENGISTNVKIDKSGNCPPMAFMIDSSNKSKIALDQAEGTLIFKQSGKEVFRQNMKSGMDDNLKTLLDKESSGNQGFVDIYSKTDKKVDTKVLYDVPENSGGLNYELDNSKLLIKKSWALGIDNKLNTGTSILFQLKTEDNTNIEFNSVSANEDIIAFEYRTNPDLTDGNGNVLADWKIYEKSPTEINGEAPTGLMSLPFTTDGSTLTWDSLYNKTLYVYVPSLSQWYHFDYQIYADRDYESVTGYATSTRSIVEFGGTTTSSSDNNMDSVAFVDVDHDADVSIQDGIYYAHWSNPGSALEYILTQVYLSNGSCAPTQFEKSTAGSDLDTSGNWERGVLYLTKGDTLESGIVASSEITAGIGVDQKANLDSVALIGAFMPIENDSSERSSPDDNNENNYRTKNQEITLWSGEKIDVDVLQIKESWALTFDTKANNGSTIIVLDAFTDSYKDQKIEMIAEKNNFTQGIGVKEFKYIGKDSLWSDHSWSSSDVQESSSGEDIGTNIKITSDGLNVPDSSYELNTHYVYDKKTKKWYKMYWKVLSDDDYTETELQNSDSVFAYFGNSTAPDAIGLINFSDEDGSPVPDGVYTMEWQSKSGSGLSVSGIRVEITNGNSAMVPLGTVKGLGTDSGIFTIRKTTMDQDNDTGHDDIVYTVEVNAIEESDFSTGQLDNLNGLDSGYLLPITYSAIRLTDDMSWPVSDLANSINYLNYRFEEPIDEDSTILSINSDTSTTLYNGLTVLQKNLYRFGILPNNIPTGASIKFNSTSGAAIVLKAFSTMPDLDVPTGDAGDYADQIDLSSGSAGEYIFVANFASQTDVTVPVGMARKNDSTKTRDDLFFSNDIFDDSLNVIDSYKTGYTIYTYDDKERKWFKLKWRMGFNTPVGLDVISKSPDSNECIGDPADLNITDFGSAGNLPAIIITYEDPKNNAALYKDAANVLDQIQVIESGVASNLVNESAAVKAALKDDPELLLDTSDKNDVVLKIPLTGLEALKSYIVTVPSGIVVAEKDGKQLTNTSLSWTFSTTCVRYPKNLFPLILPEEYPDDQVIYITVSDILGTIPDNAEVIFTGNGDEITVTNKHLKRITLGDGTVALEVNLPNDSDRLEAGVYTIQVDIGDGTLTKLDDKLTIVRSGTVFPDEDQTIDDTNDEGTIEHDMQISSDSLILNKGYADDDYVKLNLDDLLGANTISRKIKIESSSENMIGTLETQSKWVDAIINRLAGENDDAIIVTTGKTEALQAMSLKKSLQGKALMSDFVVCEIENGSYDNIHLSFPLLYKLSSGYMPVRYDSLMKKWYPVATYDYNEIEDRIEIYSEMPGIFAVIQ